VQSPIAPTGYITADRFIRAVGSLLLVGLALGGDARAADAGTWRALGTVSTLEAEFVQVQHRKILAKPLEGAGHLKFRRPEMLAWQVRSPAASTFTLDRGVATMDYPDLGVHETIDLGQLPEAQQLAASMLAWLRADPAEVERDFVVTYGAKDARLVPREATLKALLAAITVTFAEAPVRVVAVRLDEPDGDWVDIRFRGIRLDGTAVPDP
jgi:hypothetical protein